MSNPKQTFIISYTRQRGSTLYHATISEIDGDYSATWSVGDESRDGVVTKAQFDRLWNAIAEEPLFHRSRVLDENRPIDPVNHHVIGIAFNSDGSTGIVTHLVPVREGDPAFNDWLRVLQATYNAIG